MTMDIDNILKFNIDESFDRRFDFIKGVDWTLPLNVHDSNLWNINSLDILKTDLNETKSLLNDKGQDWHEHTSSINKASYVLQFVKEKIQPEILTQAWCKFYEILSNFNIIPLMSSIRTLHLCEAPGAFISALNYYLCLNHRTDWYWVANSLNPYYEGHSIRSAVVDDRFILPTLKHWYFGEDNTGDITAPSFINSICNFTKKFGLFDLITADGSFDCLENPAEQELILEKLHFCEEIVALSCLAPNGAFVLKKFTFFECSSICQLYLLNCVFEKVHVFKPFTSRPSNSEVYVICLGFHGSEELTKLLQLYKNTYCTKNKLAILPRSIIPDSFIHQIENCMKYFTSLQIKSIKDNLLLYPLKNDEILEKLDNIKIDCANAYIQKCRVFSSTVYDLSKLFKKKTLASFSSEAHTNLKSVYFHAVGDTFNNIIKSSSMEWRDKLTDVEKRINSCFPTSRKRSCEKVEWISPWKEVRKRMKSKSFTNWIGYGKKVLCIQNSKFCDPFLLHLWNRISLDAQVTVQSHMDRKYHWFSEDSLKNSLKADNEPVLQSIVAVCVSQKSCDNDCLLFHMKENYNFNVSFCINEEADNLILHDENKIVYLNATMLEESLHNECSIKRIFTNLIFLALKILRVGDTLLLCIQSILTRYSAGLMFLIISLFDKFTTILPEDASPAFTGQLWVFKNYQNCKWKNNVHQYIKKICDVNLNENDILEIIPMASVCDGSFLAYLKNINSKHLLQRLKSLIKCEKCQIKKCK